MAYAFYHIVDLVIPLVTVHLLLLPRFQAWLETVEVTEHPRALEKIDFPHFLRTKFNGFGYLFHFHKGILTNFYQSWPSPVRLPG